jgi:hypothetical protein
MAVAATAALVAGCAETSSRQVSATPPTVSYQVAGNDLARANNDAGYYCSRYGMAAQLTSVQSNANGSIASYQCIPGTSGQTYGTTSPIYSSSGAPLYGSTTPIYSAPPAPVECADFFHQSRPGGANYQGPPVPGCPQQY